ncbi:MAG: CHAT domain-containing protein [Thermoanaerobaculia bacterium]
MARLLRASAPRPGRACCSNTPRDRSPVCPPCSGEARPGRAWARFVVSAATAWLLLTLGACRADPGQPCRELLAAGRYAEAAPLCERLYRRSGEAELGLAAARARLALGEEGAALALARELPPAEEIAVLALEAEVHRRHGEADQALEALVRRRGLLEARGDAAGLADNAYRVFYLSWERSDYRRALESALEAYRQAHRAGLADLRERSAQALFTVLISLGDPAGARHALELAEPAGPKSSARAHWLANRGVADLELGRHALARESLEAALAASTGQEESRFFRSVHLNLVESLIALGEIPAARRHLEEARRFAAEEAGSKAALLLAEAWVLRAEGRPAEVAKLLEASADGHLEPDWQWELDLEAARAAESQGQTPRAEELLLRSVGAIEQLRGELGLAELKASLLERKRRPYERLFLLRAHEGRSREALAVADQATARAWVDAYVAATTPLAPPPGELWQPDAAGRVEALRELLPAMLEGPSASRRPVERVLPALAGVEVRAFFLAESEVWRITLRPGRLELEPLALDRAELERRVDRFLSNLDDAPLAEELGALLFPAGSLPAPGTPLALVPDGALSRLPFAALRVSGQYLLERHPLSLAPSLGALAELRSRKGSWQGAPVVLADAGQNLPAARAEAEAVAARLGVAPRLGSAASRAALEAARGASLLHLALHSGFDARGPWLRLADAELRPAELLSRRLGPREVVLASCASAAPASRGLWASLGAAFLAAGSRSVVATLWSVEDAASREFVENFYRLGGSERPGLALSRAARQAIAAGRPVRSWAGYVLLGAGETDTRSMTSIQGGKK